LADVALLGSSGNGCNSLCSRSKWNSERKRRGEARERDRRGGCNHWNGCSWRGGTEGEERLSLSGSHASEAVGAPVDVGSDNYSSVY
jgi:hypothetical protein